MNPRAASIVLVLALLAGLVACSRSIEAAGSGDGARITGEVRDADRKPIEGARVELAADGRPVRFVSWTDARGRYSLPRDTALGGALVISDDSGRSAPPLGVQAGAGSLRFDFSLGGSASGQPPHPSAWWLGALPESEQKRRFILDCTGCHQFNETRAYKEGAARSRDQWQADVARMLQFAGARSGFPVIAAGRDPARTAEWMTTALGSDPYASAMRSARERGTAPKYSPAQLLEVDMPVPQDLPHDVALERDGHVIITGMFTHVLQRFDPRTMQLESVALPVERANPRAVEVATNGDWWVLFGAPRTMARRSAATGEWKTWFIGHYPHSIAPEPGGEGVWFNGHFTRDPEILGRLNPTTGAIDSFVVPKHPALGDSGGPVPYELRLGPDGAVWMSELQGNRVVRVDRAGAIRLFEIPEPWSGPRRLDVDARGIVWIPAYSGGALWRLDPATGDFRRFALPIADAAPYVARVHPKTGEVWVGTAAADAVFRLDPKSGRFRSYRLATRGATVRHMAVDPERNEVWLALGASPAIHPARVVRLTALD